MQKRTKLLILLVVLLIAVVVLVVVFLLTRRNENKVETEIPVINVDTNSPLTLASLDTLVPQELTVAQGYKVGAFAATRVLNLPARFKISVFAAGLSAPRFFSFDPEGNVYTTQSGSGKVSVLVDSDKDGVADKINQIDSGLSYPSDADYYKGDLYVTQVNQVNVYRGIKPDGSYSKKEVIISNLPAGGHVSRTLTIGSDEKIYLAVGSSCNVCEEGDARRAAVSRYNLDGSGQEIYASGLRNTVGLFFRKDPVSGETELWSVDNGRDRIGDDIPPEEVNIIERGNNYGWPYCYGDGLSNPEYPEKADYCKSTRYPTYSMQAHSAPLDLAFPEADSQKFTGDLAKQLFISFHGSWNRTIPTGYKLVRVNTIDRASKEQDFLTGFVLNSGEVWGRPVGVVFSKDVLYISDDKAGAIYKIELR